MIKRRFTAIALVVMMLLATLVGCKNQSVVMKDREGTEFSMPKKLEKIISTAPSNTEVLVELGLADKLVAVDTYSMDIEGIRSDLTTIDFQAPDAETLLALEPDIIIASGHNKTGSTEDPFRVIKEAGIPVVYVPSSESIEGIYEDILFIAEVTQTKDKGEAIVKNMKKEVEQVAEIGKTITDKKKVYFEIGSAPMLYSFGNSTFLNEMIELIGAENIFKDEKAWISPSEESVVTANPDVILTNVSYTEDPVGEIKGREGWKSIKAIQNNKVFSIDVNASSRPSHHIIKALKQMAVAVYPEYYEQK